MVTNGAGVDDIAAGPKTNPPSFMPPDAQADANFGKIAATSINKRSIELGSHLCF
jgi:hypothetical protein